MLRPAIFIAVSFLAVLAVTLPDPSGDNAAVQSSAAAPQPKSTAANRAKRSDEVPSEFKKAGVCARCHVVSVLEWGISGHVAEETDCQKCHGPSRGHVANERNEVKPDRRPRGAAIAKQLCSTCHKTGCPETLQVQSCQKCHHVHALINPSKPPTTKNDRLEKLLARWERFGKQMATGEQLAGQQDWHAARAAFREALKLIPGNHRARTRLDMCRRRLNPNLPGFKPINKKFDAETGLPREVSIVDLNLSMLLVPPGEFDLGSDKLPDSRPAHTVRVDAFYLGRYEVTQAQWKSVMGNNPSLHQGAGFKNAQRMPVERVSWNDCREFIRRLNKRVPGGGFRLPTEAEWEYACRSGSRETAQEKLSAYAWFRGNSQLDPT
ncbi:MAG: SUMF1/EgtB/PvdO family nonheme iron enzyme, partial [Planctomycetes bacterium]|nr:SUMF1/EgtB/PvdO family nonheme iron enzyme [Planctomycetota bacterium]